MISRLRKPNPKVLQGDVPNTKGDAKEDTSDSVSNQVPTKVSKKKNKNGNHPLEHMAVAFCFPFMRNVLEAESLEVLQQYQACKTRKELCQAIGRNVQKYMDEYDWNMVENPHDAFNRMTQTLLDKTKEHVEKKLQQLSQHQDKTAET